jgi:hypothetical protein
MFDREPLDFAQMHTSLLVLTAFAAHAGAADFRNLNLGASCASVPAFEHSVGSREVPWQGAEGLEGYSFEGTAFSRLVSINYFCNEGRFDSGHYVFPLDTLAASAENYRWVHQQLFRTHGPPFIDSTPWLVEEMNRDPRSVQPDPRDYLTSWRLGNLWISVSLVPSNAVERSGWRTVVLYRKLPSGAKSNKSLERTRER